MENYIVSARKYRPSTFAQVVGQDAITSTLKNAIVTGHLAQAFLFTGPRGVGKTTCARIMAKTINCLNPTPDGEPCNECESCRAFNENASFNIHELDAASNNSVDDIRNLVNQVRIPPQSGKYKVYIIDEVHMLSTAAFNAFLKTLEEPPSYAKFILATTEKHKIIPTILSRCQIFDFRRIQVEDIANHLAFVARNEGIEAEEEALHVIAQKVDGALRDALSTFDQIVSYSGKKITYKDVIENLNILDYEYYFRVTDALLKGEFTALLLILDEILQNGFDGQDFLSGLNDHFRNLLVAKNKTTAKLLQTSPALRKHYEEQAARCSTALLFQALDICNQYDLDYKSSNNKRLHVEIALTRLSTLAKGMPSVTEEQTVSVSTEKPPVYEKTVTPSPEKVPVAGKEEKPVMPQEKQPVSSDLSEPKEEPPVEKTVPPQVSVEKDKKTPEPAPQEKTFTPPTTQKTTKPATENGASVGAKRSSMRNISIKETLQALRAKENGKKEGDEPVIATPFSQEKLETVWQQFVESYKSRSPSFALTLSKGNPVVKENFRIEYHVPNIVIKEDKLNVNVLLDFLKKELNNNQITLDAIVDTQMVKKEAYTDRERFEKLSKEYPVLNQLKDKLDLEFGF
ncbi:DNA polymerase III subunit gamma/tau [Candidatus Sulfidibacterium hydrothermale]|uniref:DNA polymerase III subunit gamma/tau n=1 Tax=Candidatus Sulfidibacterium hydrothermale TaxID=2875962 RepID=UPI001F0AB7BC|nr:DNA polymerase III subunit gamma/tau [Candidatus Sulfidibacterium hydrothermale]UBM61900.1 DNA polymerase III subunit gamma/tau [Candidatus Sulfidibacterium hydrothermale]